MWRVGSLANNVGTVAFHAPSNASAATSSAAAPGQHSQSDTYLGDNLSRQALLAMNAGGDAAARVANALSTASDAIGIIGGLLEHVQSALAVAKAPAAGADIAEEQTRIDSAVTTLDAIATSTRFGGQALLDGTYTTPLGANGSQAIPSFVSSHLGRGADETNAPLASLITGGPNDLASGNHDTAERIVTTAIAQVSQTQTSISGFLSQQSTAETVTADAPIPSARDSMLLSDPATAAAAVANTPAQRVLALLSAR